MPPIPVIQGLIDRRLLVNFQVDPHVIARILPAPFRPKLVRGQAIAGICLIRLKQIRPRFLPAAVGVASENAAHRIAVEWDAGGERREGVFIPRRDTDSRFNAALGGKLFPGEHHHARFQVAETDDHVSIAFTSDDGGTSVAVAGHVADRLPESSVFATLGEASAFFKGGSIGYSATSDPSRLDGLELVCRTWSMTPLAVERVRSSFFEDRAVFPEGSVRFDGALLMRGIEHEWHGQPDLCCAPLPARA